MYMEILSIQRVVLWVYLFWFNFSASYFRCLNHLCFNKLNVSQI